MIKRIHVFSAGEQTSASGETRTFTPEILKEAASSYDPGVHEAPLVIGHAGDSDSVPAFGWVKRLHVDGEKLYADVDFTDVAKELVDKGHYKKVSISFYPPDSKINPHENQWSVRHLALLGAAPPAVKGLEAFKFTENDGHLDFSSSELLTLESIVDDELGPSLSEEEGPLEVLKEKLEEARKDKEAKEAESESKTNDLEEEIDSQGEKSVQDAGDGSALPADSSFNEMAKKTDDKITDSSLEESVLPVEETTEETVDNAEEVVEETVDNAEEVVEETPEEPAVSHSESEEDEEEEEEEGDKEKEEDKDSPEGEEDVEEEDESKKKKKDSDSEDHAECGKGGKKGKKMAKEPFEEEEEEEEKEEDEDYSEMKAELEALRKEKETLAKEFKEMVTRTKKEKIQSSVSTLYAEGKLTDAVISEKDLASFCEGLEFGTLEFSEGESAATRILSLLSKLPTMVEYREVVSEVKTEEMKFNEMDLHGKALHIAQKEELSYEEALKKAVALSYSA